MILKYFYDVTEDFVKKYVRKEADRANLSDEDIDFVIYFYTNSIIGTTLRWMQDGMQGSQDQLIHRLSLAYQATIKPLISELEKNK